jgi:hypothetical protein
VTTVVPADIPVTIPVVEPISAIVGKSLLHVPPEGDPVSVVVASSHTVVVPVIVAAGFTVTSIVLIQLVISLYVIVAVPAERPVTVPNGSTDATVPGVALQKRPLEAEVKVVVSPSHTSGVPVATAGSSLTVTCVVSIQPSADVYVIVTVRLGTPAGIGVTAVRKPVVRSTVAIVGSPLTHVPAPARSVSVDVDPSHRERIPPMGLSGFTVTNFVAKQPVGTV